MSIQKLIDRYVKLQKQNYETITISQVINDLQSIKRLPSKKQMEKELRRFLNEGTGR